MERQQPPSGRTTPQSGNPNVFDDEYAIDGSEYEFGLGVADGFRAEGAGPDDRRPPPGPSRSDSPPSRSSLQRTLSLDSAATATPQAPVSRNSTSKSHFSRPSAPREPAGRPLPSRAASSFSSGHSPALFHRASTSSSASFATTARSGSPFPAATGPSHPYGMYPQNIGLARSTSVTTTSTTHTPQRASLGHRPAHPYGLYHQNVFEDREEAPSPRLAEAIPVGFPGLSSQFHRRIGPDGEEQDIVGPDGHTEQLPPYTRYPEEGPTKASLAAAQAAEEALSPPDTSQDTLVPDPQRASARASAAAPPADPSPDPAAEDGSQEAPESWSEKSWKRRRILFGKVRLWVLLLAIGVIILIAVVLGAVIGSFLTKEQYKLAQQTTPAAVVTTVVTSATTMFDASMLTATPTDLRPLPTGSFILPLYEPDETQQHCLTNPDQLNAWSCQMRGPPLSLLIEYIDGTGPTPFAAVTIQTAVPNDGDADDLAPSGMLPPAVANAKLVLVEDLDDPARGPAFHFQATYDKVVVVPPDRFPSTGYKLGKRHGPARGFPGAGFHHRQELTPGDELWFCYWNATFIEGFIYVNYNSSQSIPGWYSQSSTTNCATTPPPSLSSSPPTSTVPAAESYPDHGSGEPVGAATGGATSPTPVPTAAHTGAGAAFTVVSEYDRRRVQRDGDDYSPSAAASSSYPNPWQEHPDWPPPPPPFPRVIKIEERRLPGNPLRPYCKLMVIGDDHHAVPIYNGESEIIFQLDEEDPSASQFESANAQPPSSTAPARRAVYLRRLKREEPSNSCHCQWIIS